MRKGVKGELRRKGSTTQTLAPLCFPVCIGFHGACSEWDGAILSGTPKQDRALRLPSYPALPFLLFGESSCVVSILRFFFGGKEEGDGARGEVGSALRERERMTDDK